MFKIKFLTPYFLLIIIIFNFQILSQYHGDFLKNFFRHIDYLVTDVPIEKKLNILNADYSSFSDEMICNQSNLVKFYPELIKYKNEAKKRGLTCFGFNFNTVYFYASLI